MKETREQLNSPENQKTFKSKSVLVKDGKVYLPASLLADELGYATDHIARLARQNKVEAICENKKWYATKDSLVSYREQAKQNKIAGGLKSTSLISGKAVLSKTETSFKKDESKQVLYFDALGKRV